MIKVGDLCPIFFNPIKDHNGMESDYLQKFHSSDAILLQILSNNGESVSAQLNNLSENNSTSISFSSYQHNESVIMYYASLTGLDDGVYSIIINEEESEPFSVCSSDDILNNTTLIRFSHKDNNSAFDNIFWIDDAQQVFSFRVEGGFKPSGYSPKVDNEQYRNQMQEIEELYSVPYDGYTFIMGNSSGVPYWFARFLNRILCVSMVEIGGKKYVRSEGSVPEIAQVMEDSQLFTVSISLEPKENEVYGIGGMPQPGSSSSVVGFDINNPTEGQMLQYKEDKSAFVNVTTVDV